jgi:hypothetical protein
MSKGIPYVNQLSRFASSSYLSYCNVIDHIHKCFLCIPKRKLSHFIWWEHEECTVGPPQMMHMSGKWLFNQLHTWHEKCGGMLSLNHMPSGTWRVMASNKRGIFFQGNLRTGLHWNNSLSHVVQSDIICNSCSNVDAKTLLKWRGLSIVWVLQCPLFM